MIAGWNNIKKVLLNLFLLLLVIMVLAVCNYPGTDMIIDDPEHITKIEFFFYPSNVIIFHETFGLFCTTLYLNSPVAGVKYFDIELGFDHTVMEYESIYSHNFIVTAPESPGMLQLYASDIASGPVEYLELCTITWKAVKTSITDISLTINRITAPDGMSVKSQDSFSNTVKILEELGTIKIEGEGSIEKRTDFSNILYFDSEDKIIVDYDIDIIYDPRKISLNDTIGDNGIIIGADGFVDSISHDYGKINIKGRNDNGAGPGTDLEFLLMHWHTLDSGRTGISMRNNKIRTLDNVYIKPSIRGISISIFKVSNKPIVDIWFDPETVIVNNDESFITKIMLNTEGYTLAAYGFEVFYDSDVLEPDTSQGLNGVDAGEDGFIAAVNAGNPGMISIAGFDIAGKPPNPNLELLIIYWKAIGPAASSIITLNVKDMADNGSRTIDQFDVNDCTVTVNE
jgi:hypothetical protein